jgi:cysteine-rich repeat protein
MWALFERRLASGTRPRGERFVSLSLLLSFCAACHVYNGALIDNNVQKLPDAAVTKFDPDSCSGGECWWSKVEPDSCKSAGLPRPSDRPAAAGDGADNVDDFYLGFTQLRLGSTTRDGTAAPDAWEDFGLDLDGVCTNSSTCSGQTRVGCRSASTSVPFDGQLCRDNTFARLQPVVAAVPELGDRFGLSEDVFNCALWRGSYNTLIGIRGYNGKSDDSQVRVDFYRSTGLQETRPWTCPAPDFRNAYPRWRTSLKWRIDAGALTEPITDEGTLPDSKFADAHAYVKQGYLVAQMPDEIEQGFAGDAAPHRGFLFKAQQGVLVGHLIKAQDGTWEMRDGLAAGRIRKQDLVQAFREIGFCEDGEFASFYMSMLGYVNENADVLASGETDPGMDCDALSYGLAFEAAQLTPGAEQTMPPRIECCPPDKTDEQCSAACGDGKLSGDEVCDTGIAPGEPGACPTDCTAVDACTPRVLQGSACSVVCVPAPITAVGFSDGCCLAGANATTDRDCPALCGNGVIEGGETCEVGQPCPACASTDPCLPTRSVGNAESCNLHCEVTPVTTCRRDDRCCPSGCTSANDNDCSASCGNGAIDPGETCEKGSSKPCPASCDDMNACTVDGTTGSAANCNVVCSHTPITQAKAGDGCCPPRATAISDPDCPAQCGNGLIEPGETCEDSNQNAGDGCANCQTETPPQICMVKLNSTSACAQCTCDKCTTLALACQGASNPADATSCTAMVDCGRATGCRDPDCLCGTATGLACVTGADGPCKPEVFAAAKTMDVIEVLIRASDTNYPLGRANALGMCVTSNCAADCGI